MSLHIRAHFDGRYIVPDEPVDLPVNEPLQIEVTQQTETSSNGLLAPDASLIEERRRRLLASAGILNAPVLPDDALRRDSHLNFAAM